VRRIATVVALAACSPTATRDEGPTKPPTTETAAASRDAAAVAVSVDAAIDVSAGVAVDAAIDRAVPRPAIVDRPMKWSAERAALTLEYRRRHSDEHATDLVIEPRVIVLHYTDGSAAKGTLDYFDNIRIEDSRKDLARAGAVNVSSHFVVDRDGTIYQIQPETQFARHCIGLNHIAIGIENAGDGNKYPLTDAQVKANIALVRYLASKFPITHLLGHYEVMKFRAHPYYQERDPKYLNDKPDPGAAFMTRVREGVADRKLQGL
jgi:N-acetylmuramoyl-L-alanine amidase-like protein